MFTLGKPISNWAFPDVEAGWWLVHHSPALSIKVVCSLDSLAICLSRAAWEVNLASSALPNSLTLSQNRFGDFLTLILLKISHTCFLV